MDEDDETYCDSCMYPTSELHEVEVPGSVEKEKARLCGICYSSFAGNAYLYPRQYPDATAIRMTAFSTNKILDHMTNLAQEGKDQDDG